MIDYINGTVVQKGLNHVVVECNNIGYKLLVSQNTSYELELGKTASVYTHLIVKEDDLSLIGFSNMSERDMFRILISVSKIGAKIALSILSTYTATQIATFIKSADVVSLGKVPGLGKKTAERLVLELKDKVDIFVGSEEIAKIIKDDIPQEDEKLSQVIEALTMLGFSNKEAVSSAEKVYALDKEADVQSLIKSSLALLKK
jgi:holliday junction DNA helicase ruvA